MTDGAAPDQPADDGIPFGQPGEEALIEEALIEEALIEAIVEEAAIEEAMIEEAVEEAVAEAVVEAIVEEAIAESALSEDELLGVEEGDEDEDAVVAVESPYDRPGQWFVVHSYAGYENKVKSNLESRIASMNMEERIFEVVIPVEDVIEFKNGKKVVVRRRSSPGTYWCVATSTTTPGTSCATRRA